MIDYSPFWETLKKSNENWYALTKNHNMSDSTLHRLKHNKDISTKTINLFVRKGSGTTASFSHSTSSTCAPLISSTTRFILFTISWISFRICA